MTGDDAPGEGHPAPGQPPSEMPAAPDQEILVAEELEWVVTVSEAPEPAADDPWLQDEELQ